jgi:hypothetical protein
MSTESAVAAGPPITVEYPQLPKTYLLNMCTAFFFSQRQHEALTREERAVGIFDDMLRPPVLERDATSARLFGSGLPAESTHVSVSFRPNWLSKA